MLEFQDTYIEMDKFRVELLIAVYCKLTGSKSEEHTILSSVKINVFDYNFFLKSKVNPVSKTGIIKSFRIVADELIVDRKIREKLEYLDVRIYYDEKLGLCCAFDSNPDRSFTPDQADMFAERYYQYWVLMMKEF